MKIKKIPNIGQLTYDIAYGCIIHMTTCESRMVLNVFTPYSNIRN